MNNLDAAVDRLIEVSTRGSVKEDELVSTIDPRIWFRYNSVNLVVARRGSGKTHMVLKEILKLMMLGHKEYTQLFYVSDKTRDDTFEKLSPLLLKYLQVTWVTTDEALTLFQALEKGKAHLTERPEYKECLNAESLQDGRLPHSLILFDDCAHLFSKPSELSKKLFQNRQSRTTIFLMLQDVTSISASVKSNINALVLFGSFSAHKYNVLAYQLPPNDFTLEDYNQLGPNDYVLIDFEDGTYSIHYRD